MKLHLPKTLHKRLLALMLTVGVLGTQQVFAVDYTIGTSDNNDQRLKDATAEDKIIFDKDGGHLTSGGATINAAVEINKLKLTDGYSDVTYTFKNTVSGTGEFSFGGSTGANNQTYVFEGDMSQYSGNMTIADNKTATFTFKGIEVGATSITGANVQFTDGASSDATINIKSDRTLIIGHEAQNDYTGGFQGQSVDLSGATVNLTGGNVRFNGDNSSLGTLNADGGTLRLEDGVKDGNGSGDTAGNGLNIDTLNLVSNLLVNNRWKGSLDIDVLKGSGAVTFDTKNGSDVISVKIDSVEAGARILSNSGTLILGDGETSTINLSNTIDNKGTLILNGTLAVSNDDLSGFDSQIIGIADVTENGLFDIGTKYILIKGNALDASSTTTTVSYNGQTYNIADGITLGGRKGYAVVESDKAVTLGGSNATEGTADAALIYVNGGKLTIAEGTYTVNTSDAGSCDIIYTAGSMTLEADATLQTVSGNISSIVKNSTGSGTLEIGNGGTNLIAGNDTYDYSGKISVKSGGQLNLNQEGSGGNSMNNISLANATIDMDGGRVRYFGGNATIGTVNVNANSTLEAFATWNSSDEGVVTINNMTVTKVLTIEGQYESSITIKDLTLNDTMLLNANSQNSGAKSMVTIEQLSGTGMLQLLQGNYTLAAGTHTINELDASKGGDNKGTLTLAAGANLTVNSRMWVALEEKTAGIKLGKGASLTRGEVKFTGSTDTESSISRVTDGNHGDEYGIGNASYVVKNAAVEVESDSAKTISNRLQGVALSNTGTGLLTASNGYNNLTELQALTGDINMTWYNQQQQQGTISNLNIAAGRTVGAYTKGVGTAKATVTVSGLTAGAGATLNANLILTNGAALTFDGSLALGNSTLTLGSGLTLDANTLAAIKNLSGDDRYELFTGVGALTLGEKTYTMGTDVLDATSGIDLSKYFTLADAQTPAVLSDEQLSSGYYLGFDANGTLYAGVIPEPTTATLSLLALAALAARRRRK